MIQYGNGWIMMSSEYQFAPDMLLCPGATTIEGGIAVPGTKVNFMALEAFGSFVASEEYVTARRAIMTIDEDTISKIKKRMKKWGIASDELMPHQIQYIAERVDQPTTFNASEQGTGKTLMSLVDLRMKGVSRVLLIGPRDVCLQWGDEIRDRGIDFLFHAGVSGTKEERLKVMNQCDDFGGIFAINFEMVDALEEYLKKVAWEAIVIDEGYRIKNHNSQTSKACHRLAKLIPIRQLLNGTPIGNHVGDFYAQIKFLLGPAKFMSYAEFRSVFINMQEIYTAGGQKQEVERGCKDPIKLMYLLEPLWFRATKETCLDLPPMVQQTLWFDMPTEMQHIYARTVVDGEQALGYEASLSDQRVVMLRLQQICGGHIPIYTPTQIPIGESIDDYEEIPGFCYEPVECAKLRWLSSFVKSFVGGDPSRRVIVWCRFTSEVLRVTQELRDVLEDPAAVAYVTGAVGPEMVGQIKLLFNSRRTETVRVIVAQISKMYNGHNLQAGDVHVHYNHTWSYIMKDQSMSRSHRHGREDRVDIINLAYKNSIDQGCLASLRYKRDLSIKMSPDTIGKYS